MARTVAPRIAPLPNRTVDLLVDRIESAERVAERTVNADAISTNLLNLRKSAADSLSDAGRGVAVSKAIRQIDTDIERAQMIIARLAAVRETLVGLIPSSTEA